MKRMSVVRLVLVPKKTICILEVCYNNIPLKDTIKLEQNVRLMLVF